jgi:hypothetical protein
LLLAEYCGAQIAILRPAANQQETTAWGISDFDKPPSAVARNWLDAGSRSPFQIVLLRINIYFMAMGTSRSRRKLSNVVARTAITSYFTEQEKQEIVFAAENEGISMSAFVAAAALKGARRLNASHSPSSSHSPKK